MPRNVTRIPEAQRIPVKGQKLRVAAYCRVSTKHKEQQQSLQARIDYYTNYIQNHSNWVLVAVYSDSGEVPQPIWPGCIGDHPSNQEVK